MSKGWIGVVALSLSLVARPAQDEDAAGTRGRAELAASIERALSARGDAPQVEPSDEERALGIPFTAVEAGGARVLATSGLDEARRVARALGAARDVFVELGGAPAELPAGLRVYLLGTREAKDAFHAKHPRLGAENGASLAGLECAGIPGTADWGFWQADADERLDGALRLGLSWLAKQRGVTLGAHAWLHEGLGFYLARALGGSYTTWFVPLEPGDAKKDGENVALQAQMKEPGADWLALARGLFAPSRKLDFEELLHLQADELDPSDVLRVHALSAYLVEVHRAALGGIVGRVGAGDDPREAIEDALGAPLAEVRVRLDGWLERREELVARADGRRTDAELEAQWKKLSPFQRKAFVAAFVRLCGELETQQMRWVRARAGTRPEVPRAGDLPFYDPKVHAPGDPIPRRRLGAGDGRVKRVLKGLPEPSPRAPRLAYDYDWGAARIVRVSDPADPEDVFHNALLGVPPGADLARADVLATLDHPGSRKLQAAFSHAYTDRDGGVYPVSLYEMWATGETIEMPDVDTLGIVHDVLDEWARWKAPVPAAQHAPLYKVLGELYSACRGARELRLALAELYTSPALTPRAGYETAALNLQTLWAANGSDPREVAKGLPDGKGTQRFLEDLVALCKRDFKLYGQGRRRAATLRADQQALRRALGAALDEGAAATPPSPTPR